MPTPLDGHRVIDLSTGIPGGYATKMLADAGADVVKVESPDGDALRRWTAHGAVPEDDGAVFQFLAASKRSVVADPASAADVAWVRELAAGADGVVWSPGSTLAALPELHPRALCEAAPHATVLSVTRYGLEGPWAERPATEFTLQASAGTTGGRGNPDRAPIAMGGQLGYWVTGMFAAAAYLASRHRTVQTGVGELLDGSSLESLAYIATMHPVTFQSIAGVPMRPVRAINLPEIYATKDGYVGFMVVTGQQWLDFCVMVEQPQWLEDAALGRMNTRVERRDELIPSIEGWMAARTTAEVVEMANLLRIPVAEVGTGETIPDFDHFVERDFFTRNPRGGFVQPQVPHRFGAGAQARPIGSAPTLGEHTSALRAEAVTPKPTGSGGDRLPFDGLRIADFTANWAGPSASHVLAMLGADVIHVESPKRPDAIRFNTIKPMTEDGWWEWSPLFHGANTGKRGLGLDVSNPEGRDVALRLVAQCDVVMENYSPRVLEQWGLDYDALRAVRPDVILTRMPAFGISGPWRDRTGYAQTMEMTSGMAWVTGYPEDLPRIPNGPCDPIAGVHAAIATMLALEHRRRTGEGMLLESPMIGGALNLAAAQVVEHSAYGVLLSRTGNRSQLAAPQGLYLSADADGQGRRDRWVAVSVETDAQWDALARVLGVHEPVLRACDARQREHDRLDQLIADWVGGRGSDAAAETLSAAGVPAAVVMMPHEQPEVPQFAARQFFDRVDHPVLGERTYQGFPVRFGAGPARVNRSHSPLLGQDNADILGGLLGLSEAEIAKLVEAGVVGDRPGGGGAAW